MGYNTSELIGMSNSELLELMKGLSVSDRRDIWNAIADSDVSKICDFSTDCKNTKPVQDLQPVFCAFIFADIHSEHVLFAVHINAYRYVNSLLDNPALVANVIVYCVHKNYRISGEAATPRVVVPSW